MVNSKWKLSLTVGQATIKALGIVGFDSIEALEVEVKDKARVFARERDLEATMTKDVAYADGKIVQQRNKVDRIEAELIKISSLLNEANHLASLIHDELENNGPTSLLNVVVKVYKSGTKELDFLKSEISTSSLALWFYPRDKVIASKFDADIEEKMLAAIPGNTSFDSSEGQKDKSVAPQGHNSYRNTILVLAEIVVGEPMGNTRPATFARKIIDAVERQGKVLTVGEKTLAGYLSHH